MNKPFDMSIDEIFIGGLLCLVFVCIGIMIYDWAITGTFAAFILGQIQLCLGIKIISDWKLLTESL